MLVLRWSKSKCLRGSAPAYLADYCNSTSLVPGRSALRSAAHGDIVVPSHRTDWGLRSFAVAGPSSWNALPVDLRSSSFGLDTFAKHLKTHLFGLAYSRQSTHFWVCITFCRVRHGDSVTKPDYYIIIIKSNTNEFYFNEVSVHSVSLMNKFCIHVIFHKFTSLSHKDHQIYATHRHFIDFSLARGCFYFGGGNDLKVKAIEARPLFIYKNLLKVHKYHVWYQCLEILTLDRVMKYLIHVQLMSLFMARVLNFGCTFCAHNLIYTVVQR